MKVLLILFLSMLLSSCSLSIPVQVAVSPFSDTPWEEESGKEIWYKARWFDGREVHTEYLDRGEWKIRAKVYPGSLSVFAFYPLGSMEPMGGFWENDERAIYLSPEDGYFASMLIDAAEEIPEAVAELSVKKLRAYAPDLGALNRSVFLSLVYQGKVEEGRLELSQKFSVPLEGVLKGKWVSSSSRDRTINVTSSSSPGTVSLFPGIWHYLCFERNLMLTITVDESGRYWTKLSSPPLW